MPTINPQLVALGTQKFDRQNLKILLDDPYRAHLFDNYDPDTVSYVSAQGGEVARGFPALRAYMEANPARQVFLGGHTKLFDLALEGGGAFGFAHLGTLHAMALRGIWFDRVSGTSAGSIAAALVAAGYRVDLNYKTVTDRPPTALEPDWNNSLNQILFDDVFRNFTDFEQRTDRVKAIVTDDDSFVHKIVERFLRSCFNDLESRLANIGNNLHLTRVQVVTTYLNIQRRITNAFLDLRVQMPGGTVSLDGLVLIPATPSVVIAGQVVSRGTPEVTVGSVIRDARDIDTLFTNVLNDAADDLISDLTGNNGPVHDAIEAAYHLVFQGVMEHIVNPALEALVVKNGVVQHIPYGLFRLLEFGGFYDGDHVRDWLERHLQMLVKGTGPKLDGTGGKPDIKVGGVHVNAVLFKDLKIDLCLVGTDMGPVGGAPWRPEPVYFSKRTTPDYPVAEAVRRSVSLPAVFIPRKINEGYGNNPPDIVLPKKQVGGPSLLRDILGRLDPSKAPRYDNRRRHDHLIFDGGGFVNLPVAVFREPSDFVFDNKKETKPLIISNINSTVDSSTRPDDLPLTVLPEPFKSFKGYAADTMPLSGGPLVSGAGFLKLNRAVGFLGTYIVGENQETEINNLLQLIPNSFFVDMHLRDPEADNSSSMEFTSDGGRIDAGIFNMSKTAKKWLVKNGFDAALAAFKQYETEVPALRGKLALPKEVDPYTHILEIKNPTANGVVLPEPVPRCKQGDNPYTGGELFVGSGVGSLALGSENAVNGYVGIGGTWVKMADIAPNQTASGAQFLTFDTNMRTRVLLAIDATPSFATAANGWERLVTPLRLASRSSSTVTVLNVFGKVFEKGRVNIPGPRAGAAINNRRAYAVLVCPI